VKDPLSGRLSGVDPFRPPSGLSGWLSLATAALAEQRCRFVVEERQHPAGRPSVIPADQARRPRAFDVLAAAFSE